MIFSIDERLFSLFPALRIGILVCEVYNIKYGDDQLEEIIDDIRVRFSFERPQDHPNLTVWREAFLRVGISPADFQNPLETLLKQALRGGPIMRINPLVDLCRALSLRHLVPISGHSLNMVEGDLALCFAAGTETYIPMDLGEQEIVEKDEIIYSDSADALTRRWLWKQSHKVKIENETTRVFIPIHIMEKLPDWLCETVMDDLQQSIISNGYGSVIHRDILTKGRGSSSFTH